MHLAPSRRLAALPAAAVAAGLIAAALIAAPLPAAAAPLASAAAEDPPGTTAAGLPIELEAEDAVLAGGAGVNDNHLGYSGSGFVDGFVIDHTGTAAVTFTVDVPVEGDYGLNLRYTNGLGSDMTLSQVAGGEDRQVVLPSAAGASWSFWFVHQEVVHLAAGPQQVTYRFDADDTGNVNLDAIALTTVGDLSTPGGGRTDPGEQPGAGPDTRWDGIVESVRTTKPKRGGTAFEAETAHRANGAVATADGGAVDLTAERARLVVAVNADRAGKQDVVVRYRAAAEASVVVAVDGHPVGRLALPTRGGEEWRDVAMPLTLREGIGTIELRRTGDAAGGRLAVDAVRLRDGSPVAARGATVPFTTHEAERGTTNGEVLAPSRTFRELAAEASGRQAVTLSEPGQYVEWRLDAAANALVVRASIPDTADGAGQSTTLAVLADGRKVGDVPVSSVYAWVYGGYPYGNDPEAGGAQRFFDDGSVRLPRLREGTVLRLEKDASSGALPITVDLAETEDAPEPYARPAGSLDVRDFGAVADDGIDDAAAFGEAIAAAQETGGIVWVPEGRFTLAKRLRLHGVTLRGAGAWYSVLEGVDGRGGLYAMGSGTTIADLKVDGDVRYRDDARFDAAVEGAFGQGSLVQGVWAEHTKVGLWVDAGTDGLAAVDLRVRNTFADGVHLHGAVADTRVEHASVRNTGDDAMAMWSSGGAVARSSFVHATVQTPLLGNGAAVYGGEANRVSGLLVRDTLTAAAGVAVSTRFNPVPFSGTTVVEDSTLIRTGGWEPNWNTSFGAIWVFADTSHLTTPVVLRDLDVLDSTYEGLLVSGGHWVDDLRVADVRIDGTGSYAVAARVGGEHRFANVRATRIAAPADGPTQFWGTFIDEGGNLGLVGPAPAACSVEVDGSEEIDGVACAVG
ncbi:hypothetical protein GE115_06915 [Agromyces sp. CFH 90414]|uniref:CBM6 domain-containing protein n=1 Tax=Agromyces agglutinans TaxID=2662258 RepID=A0A6I2F5P5_9MICO|nr:glycosyl hydrolase family 28-related protein [Agromyces agglutinans]MRG59601.1 hypothetical protein [Agromyces agglutinans]